MAKTKSKRQLVRDERRKKKRNHEQAEDADRTAKRQRRSDDVETADYIPLEEGHTNGNSNGGDVFFTDVGGGGGPRHSHGNGDDFGDENFQRQTWDTTFQGGGQPGGYGPDGDREFFGLLSDPEQEYFRRADELLELNDFPSAEERQVFLASVFREAKGKELKLASSQSCSRLMERLVQVANTTQKKRLFRAFSGHIMSLVTHRFASHCCEQLFLQSAGAVQAEFSMGPGGTGESTDAARSEDGQSEEEEEEGDKDLPSMEELFLYALDELEPHLSALLTDRFASHTLRVLLVVLAGRPRDEASTQLVRSKKKESVVVGGRDAKETKAAADSSNQARLDVPESFTLAVRKIISDITTSLDGPALRVLALHPTGNPVLQLLLELDLEQAKGGRKDKKKKGGKSEEDESKEAGGDAQAVSLMECLLPGTPASLNDPTSAASDLLRTLVYDRVGSRLLETLLVHASSKLFKPIYQHMFGGVQADGKESKSGDDAGDESSSSSPAAPMAVYLRNEVACYPAMRVLERLSRDDLTDVLRRQILVADTAAAKNGGRTLSSSRDTVTQLVARGRFAVLRTLFERCQARNVDGQVVRSLVAAVVAAAGGGRGSDEKESQLVVKLCLGGGAGGAGETEEATKKPKKENENSNEHSHATGSTKKPDPATIHGCLLVTAMLGMPGPAANAAQQSLLALSGDQLAQLATASSASARILVTVLQTLPTTEAEEAEKEGEQHAKEKNAKNAKHKSDRHTKNKAGHQQNGHGHQQRRQPSHPPPHKQIVAKLVPHAVDLAVSPAGQAVLVTIIQTPSRVGSDGNGVLLLPFHLKDAIVSQLAAHEEDLRESWAGRTVWRAWRPEMWKQRRSEWVHWAKDSEPEGLKTAVAPTRKEDKAEKKEKKERKERGPEKEEANGDTEMREN